MRRISVLLVVIASLTPGLRAAAAQNAEDADAESGGTDADFNGDGFGDLAIGVPSEGGDSVAKGGVNVIYGSAGGLSATAVPDQFWDQNSGGVEGTAELFDGFGSALAAGDFNGDTFADVAIGSPRESVLVPDDTAGAANVIYGSPSGLSATYIVDDLWDQESTDIEGVAEDGDQFGTALAVGDVNGTFDDLAIGVPGEEVGGHSAAGAVNVIYGSAIGLSATIVADQIWTQDSSNVNNKAENGDEFGGAVAAADFGGSAEDDLAVGVPDEKVNGFADAGSVAVIYGSATGLSATATPDQTWSQESSGIAGSAEDGDHFGSALAAANFGGGIQADLAIGIPREDFAALDDGGVEVIYGAASGLSSTGSQFWSQGTTNVEDDPGDIDTFGDALAAANFGSTLQADLAIGSPGDDIGFSTGGGKVNVIYGAPGRLSAIATPDQVWSQNSPDVEDNAQASETFGNALAAAG